MNKNEKVMSSHVMPEWFFPYWRCKKCGRKYTALENICFFCKEKLKKEALPPRHQYIDIPTYSDTKRLYYQSNINLDFIANSYELKRE